MPSAREPRGVLGTGELFVRTEHTSIDLGIAECAGRQHGVITRAQLRSIGLDDSAIGYRARQGRLLRLYRGVYAVGHRPPSPLARAAAAVLACGARAVLSHRSALTLWGLARPWRFPPEVTTSTYRRPHGIRVHGSRSLLPQHVTVHFGIPVTTVARTLLDVVDRLDDKTLTRAVNDARLARHLRQWELAALVEQFPGRTGAARLRPYFATLEAPTRSDLEDAFLAFVERHGLPRPVVNVHVLGHEVDAYFRDHRLAVELDGYDTHGERSAFEADRDRDADLLAAGIPTVRITHERIIRAPGREAERLRAILGAEGEGFEPSNEVDPRYAISSRARSTAPAPLQAPARVAADGRRASGARGHRRRGR